MSQSVLAGRLRRIVVVIVPLVLGCCRDANDPGSTKASLTITIADDPLVKIPGYNVIGPTYDRHTFRPFTVERNGYAGLVTLSVDAEGPVTATVQQFDAGVDRVTATLGVDAPNGSTAGDYSVTIHATQADGRAVSKTITVRVTPFALALMPPTVTVSQGNTVSLRVNVAGSSPTTVTATGAPAGVTLTASTQFIDIAAAADATPATSMVTVVASGGGHSESRTFSLVVQPSKSRRSVSFRLCWGRGLDFSGTSFFANDGEPWTTMTADASGTFTIDATDRVSIAEVIGFTGGYAPSTLIRVVNLTATELEQMQCPSSQHGTETYTIAPSNATDYLVSIGTFRASVGPGSSLVLTPSSNRAGTFDLIASGRRADGSFTGIIRRDQDYAPAASIALDFSGPEAFVLDSATHGFSAVTGDQRWVISRLHTQSTVGALMPIAATQVSDRYRAVPGQYLAPTDVQSLMLASTTGYPSSTSAVPTRGVVQYFRAAAPLTVTPGSAIATASVDTAARLFLLPSQPEYGDIAGVRQRLVRDYRGVYIDVEIWQTKAFAGGTPATWSFMMPVFGRAMAVPPMDGSVPLGAAGGGTAVLYFGAQGADGLTLRWASRMGRYLPFPFGL